MMMQEWHPLSNPTKENREGGGGCRNITKTNMDEITVYCIIHVYTRYRLRRQQAKRLDGLKTIE